MLDHIERTPNPTTNPAPASLTSLPAHPLFSCRYFGLGAGTAIMSIGLSAKPDNLDNWADKKAAENLGATLKQQQ